MQIEEKYLELLDEDMLNFIQRTEEFYPADAVTASMPEQRSYYESLAAEFAGAIQDDVEIEDEFYSSREVGFQVRHYTNKQRQERAHIVYYHGGGYVVGSLSTHDSICAEICSRSSCNVTAVDYRLAPEHIHPAAFEDCLVAFRRVSSSLGKSIIVMGDSAGGNLAGAVSHATRGEQHAPIGQILIYPALGSDMTSTSFAEHANAPLLSKSDMEFYEQTRAGGIMIATDPTAYPLADSDFSELPQTILITADCDPLRDDAKKYRDKIAAAGGKVLWINEKGLVHGFLRARHCVEKATDSFTRTIGLIEMIADGSWDFS